MYGGKKKKVNPSDSWDRVLPLENLATTAETSSPTTSTKKSDWNHNQAFPTVVRDFGDL